MFSSARTPLANIFSSFAHPTRQQCIRCLHKGVRNQEAFVPKPTPFVPDPKTFLTLIGRSMSKHASKIEDWKALFTLSSPELRELGIEPARSRRYLLRWREKFRRGEYGVGGDLKYVEDGKAELRIIDVPRSQLPASLQQPQHIKEDSILDGVFGASLTQNPGSRKIIMNLPPGVAKPDTNELQKWERIKGMQIHNGSAIKGSYVQPMAGWAGEVARLVVTEGMWEHRRGHKVDGGERRKKEVRHKKRMAERKAKAE